MFAAGAFSANPGDPLRVDADVLCGLSADTLRRGFQVSDTNPLVGIDGPLGLLRRLGQVVMEHPADGGAGRDPEPPEGRLPGDLVVRTTPDIDLRRGMQVPLLVDIAHLFVFDQHGERICPAPARLPDLEE